MASVPTAVPPPQSPDAPVVALRGLVLSEDPEGTPGLDLCIGRGETVGLLGDDQVRLTRIIRVVGGLELPAAGTVLVLGVDIGRATRRQLHAVRRHIGYVSVAGGLMSNMTVRQNVELGLRYHGLDDKAARRRGDELLALAGLRGVADTPASVVPAEYQKCAAYVRALAADPLLLLIEDPAAFLHPEGRAAIERLHNGLRASGTTVLLADDDIDLAQRLVARAVRLSGATITSDGPCPSSPRSPASTGRTENP